MFIYGATKLWDSVFDIIYLTRVVFTNFFCVRAINPDKIAAMRKIINKLKSYSFEYKALFLC